MGKNIKLLLVASLCLASSSNTFAGCWGYYSAAHDRLNKIVEGDTAGGGLIRLTGYLGVVYVAAVATTGGIGAIPVIGVHEAYQGKSHRLRFFSRLIVSANVFALKTALNEISPNETWKAPYEGNTLVGMGKYRRYDRVFNHVQRLSGRKVSDAEIAQAIVRADDKDAFCEKNNKGEIELKTSMNDFAQVIVQFL